MAVFRIEKNRNYVENKNKTIYIVVITVLLIIAVALFIFRSCSDDTTTDPTPNGGEKNYTFGEIITVTILE